jgi:hypothetical protein
MRAFVLTGPRQFAVREVPAPVAATVGLEQVGPVLAGEPVAGAGNGPKIHVDPTLG